MSISRGFDANIKFTYVIENQGQFPLLDVTPLEMALNVQQLFIDSQQIMLCYIS